jgi:uroporphyrinogen III methyltransferase/synthase
MKPPRIVITASDGALPGLAAALNAAGFAAVHHPLVVVRPPEHWDAVDATLAQLNRFEAAVFTSPRAVHAVRGRLALAGIELPPGLAIWAAGDATAAPLAGVASRVQLAPAAAVGRNGAGTALAAAMLAAGVPGPVVFFCGDPHRPELADALRLADVECHEVICYRTRPVNPQKARLALDGADAAVVASPLAARLVIEAVPRPLPQLIALGPTTANAARAFGWEPAGIAVQPDTESLVTAASALLTAR